MNIFQACCGDFPPEIAKSIQTYRLGLCKNVAIGLYKIRYSYPSTLTR